MHIICFLIQQNNILATSTWSHVQAQVQVFKIDIYVQVSSKTSLSGLRSADTTNYVQPRTRTKFAERAFSYAGMIYVEHQR